MSDLHPVRFTKDQVEFLRHLFNESGYDYFEEECTDLEATIKKSEEGCNENDKH